MTAGFIVNRVKSVLTSTRKRVKSVKSGTYTMRSVVLRKNKTGSSQVGAIFKAQKYSKNNYWKHLEKIFFKKKIFEIFFRKKYFFRKSHNAEKLKKRPFRLIKRFYKPKTSKKCKGLHFDRIRKFSKKKSHSAEKTQRGDPLVSPAVLLEA